MKRVLIFGFTLFAAAAFLISLPATDARFLKVEITYHLQNDGSWDMEYSHQVRLETYYAVNRALGETFILYNPDFQKLEILKAETTMADGRKVAAPANAFNEVLPYAAHGFADFSGLCEMVVTHTGLERGAVIDLHYRLHTKAGFLPGFTGREVLARDFPVDAYKLTLIVPSGQELRYRVFGPKIEAEVSASGAEKRYTFVLANVPAAAHEPLALVQAAAFVVFSSFKDWGQALALGSDPSPLPAALAEKIEKLKAQYPDRPDLLAALQKVAATEVQNCILGPDMVGWQPRPLGRVWQSNYGTRLEKALLLKAMLQKAGFAAELLAVAAGPSFAADVPTPLQFDEFWLKVAESPGFLYLDPCQEQNEFFPYRVQGLDAWNLERKELEKLPASGWEQNGVDVSGRVRMDPSGVSGTLTVAVRGIFNRYYEAIADNNKFITEVLKKYFPLDKVEVKKLLALTRREICVEAEISGKWLKASGAGLEGPRREDFFTVDACRLPGLSENMVIVERRSSPLVLAAPFKVSLQLDMEMAVGMRLEYAAPEIDMKDENGYFTRGLLKEKNGHIRFFETCGIEKTMLDETYPHLRELLMPYFTPDLWLVFKKNK